MSNPHTNVVTLAPGDSITIVDPKGGEHVSVTWDGAADPGISYQFSDGCAHFNATARRGDPEPDECPQCGGCGYIDDETACSDRQCCPTPCTTCPNCNH